MSHLRDDIERRPTWSKVKDAISSIVKKERPQPQNISSESSNVENLIKFVESQNITIIKEFSRKSSFSIFFRLFPLSIIFFTVETVSIFSFESSQHHSR